MEDQYGVPAADQSLTFRERLLRIYRVYAPEKEVSIDNVLFAFAGRGDEMIAMATQTYGPEPSEDFYHLVMRSSATTEPEASDAPIITVSTPDLSQTEHCAEESQANQSSYSQRLMWLFLTYCPDKLLIFDDVLYAYRGHEEQMIADFMELHGITEEPNAYRRRLRLRRFYEHHCPEKLDCLERILVAYAAEPEDKLFNDLQRKYGPEPVAFDSNDDQTSSTAGQQNQRSDARSRLERFYDCYAPHMLSHVDDILDTYSLHPRGFSHLFSLLESKYGPEPALIRDDEPIEEGEPASVIAMAESPSVAVIFNGHGVGPAVSEDDASFHAFRKLTDRLYRMLIVHDAGKLPDLYTVMPSLSEEDANDLLLSWTETYGAEPSDGELRDVVRLMMARLTIGRTPAEFTSSFDGPASVGSLPTRSRGIVVFDGSAPVTQEAIDGPLESPTELLPPQDKLPVSVNGVLDTAHHYSGVTRVAENESDCNSSQRFPQLATTTESVVSDASTPLEQFVEMVVDHQAENALTLLDRNIIDHYSSYPFSIVALNLSRNFSALQRRRNRLKEAADLSGADRVKRLLHLRAIVDARDDQGIREKLHRLSAEFATWRREPILNEIAFPMSQGSRPSLSEVESALFDTQCFSDAVCVVHRAFSRRCNDVIYYLHRSMRGEAVSCEGCVEPVVGDSEYAEWRFDDAAVEVLQWLRSAEGSNAFLSASDLPCCILQIPQWRHCAISICAFLDLPAHHSSWLHVLSTAASNTEINHAEVDRVVNFISETLWMDVRALQFTLEVLVMCNVDELRGRFKVEEFEAADRTELRHAGIAALLVAVLREQFAMLVASEARLRDAISDEEVYAWSLLKLDSERQSFFHQMVDGSPWKCATISSSRMGRGPSRSDESSRNVNDTDDWLKSEALNRVVDAQWKIFTQPIRKEYHDAHRQLMSSMVVSTSPSSNVRNSTPRQQQNTLVVSSSGKKRVASQADDELHKFASTPHADCIPFQNTLRTSLRTPPTPSQQKVVSRSQRPTHSSRHLDTSAVAREKHSPIAFKPAVVTTSKPGAFSSFADFRLKKSLEANVPSH